jgi:hypothetical protein
MNIQKRIANSAEDALNACIQKPLDFATWAIPQSFLKPPYPIQKSTHCSFPVQYSLLLSAVPCNQPIK